MIPVITGQKDFDEIHDNLTTHGELSTVVIGCDKCAKEGLCDKTNVI